jgi:hypothetical protein
MNTKQILMDKHGYTEAQAEAAASSLAKLTGRLAKLRDEFLTGERDADATDYNGYSIDSLKKKYHMNFVAALLTLDWLEREPVIAGNALKSGIK